MSRVYLLAADKPLPAREQESFSVAPLNYYRQAVDELGYPMKPFRSEILLEESERDLRNLRAYLEENFSRGEVLELWSVWVGDVDKKRPPRFCGRLGELDREALEQFLNAEEICFTITV